MDIDQLKLILEMVGVATDAGITVAILYLVLPLVEVIIYFVGWSLFLPIILKLVLSGIKELAEINAKASSHEL